MLALMNRFVVAVACVVAAPLATADPAPEPWQVGVTDAQKATAQAKLDEGNSLFVENRYDAALVAYEAGLAAWDHPSIRFNVAATLIALDRPVEAQAQLDKAMQYGAKPLGDQWREALTYRALLARQVSTVRVRCTQPGVEITLDNQTLGKCPGEQVRRVRAGEHVLVGQRTAFLTTTRKLNVVGGQDPIIDLALISLADATVTRTRWPAWKPWAVTAGGAVIAAAGLGLELSARSQRDDYRRALIAECSDVGCAPGTVSASTAALESSARFRDRAGVTVLVVGGLGVAAGVALLVMNRAHTEVPGEHPLAVAPMIAPSGLGLAVTGSL